MDECTATVRIAMRRQVRITRQAISPRFAMRILANMKTEGYTRAPSRGEPRVSSRSIGRIAVAAALAAGIDLAVHAQPIESGFVALPSEPMDAITPAARARIWSEIEANRARLRLDKAGARPSFQWPLRPVRGYSSPGYES